MTKEHEDQILNEAIHEFGEYAQLQMLIEECAELIQAVCKYCRNPQEENKLFILEEIADVLVMTQQAQIMYGFETVSEIRWQKLLRLEARLEVHKNNKEKDQ